METTIKHKYKVGTIVYNISPNYYSKPPNKKKEKVLILAVGIDLHNNIFYWVQKDKDIGDMPKIARENDILTN